MLAEKEARIDRSEKQGWQEVRLQFLDLMNKAGRKWARILWSEEQGWLEVMLELLDLRNKAGRKWG